MHGWANVETARCGRCAVYTPTTDLVFSTDGHVFCTSCGVPPAPTRAAPATDWSVPDFRPSMFKRVEHPARVAALVMLAVTLCFPLAACVSQL